MLKLCKIDELFFFLFRFKELRINAIFFKHSKMVLDVSVLNFTLGLLGFLVAL